MSKKKGTKQLNLEQKQRQKKGKHENNKKFAAKMKSLDKAKDKANEMLHKVGGHGTEISATVNDSRMGEEVDLMVPTASQILQVTARVQDRAIAYLSMGIILRAIRRGLLSSQQDSQRPYYMFRFLIEAFTSAMLSGVSVLTEAPLWWWEIYHALKPKQARFKTATIQYKWSIEDTGLGVNASFPLGNGTSAYTLFWGTSTTGQDVDGFPVLAPGPAYTSELGISAIATLWASCSPKTPLMPDPVEKTATYSDTSAFGINYPELGASYAAVGGMRSTIYSERHIDSPLFAKFAEYQPAGTAFWRGWHKAGLSAGSASMIGPKLMDFNGDKGAIRNKVPPTIKVYNFDEIFEQLSLTMCIAVENLANAAGQVTVQCPLTSQQVQILLRQAIIGFFSNDMCQDLRYEGNDRITLLPFTVGPNGSQSATVDMLLPTFLAENIRCMKLISAEISKEYKDAVATWYPVLARPSPSELPQLGQYVWGGNSPLYAVNANEVPINIIDMSAPFNQSTVYLDVSRMEIQVIKDFWNEWISRYTAVLSPLVSLTSQKGIRVLNCNILTNSVQYQPTIPPLNVPTTAPLPAQLHKKKSTVDVTSIGISMASQRRKLGADPDVGSSYFDQIVENEVTSVEAVKAQTWGFLSKWILPVDFANDQINDSTSQGVRAFQIEPNKIPRSSIGGLGGSYGVPNSRPDSLSRHLTAAQIDAKAFVTQDRNELIEWLVAVGVEGRGGFFTSLVSSMVNTFSPDAAKVIDVIGSAIGI